LNRRTAKSQKLIGEQAQIRVYLFGNIRKAAGQVPACADLLTRRLAGSEYDA
jgi:hypothetical protein